jgi:uncharacterized cupredoxin-like copper-binding protein
VEVQSVIRSTTAMILAVSVLAAACGGGGQTSGDSGGPDAHIRVNMTEYGFGSDVIEVRAGQTVEFLLKNSGDLDHEFMIGREVTATMGGMATGFEHDFFEGLMPIVDPPEAVMDMESMDMGMDDMDMDDMDMDDMDMDDMDMDGHDDHHHGFMVVLAPGATASLTVTIPDDAVGDWEIGCFRDKGTHWSSGMRAELRITS